jgi:hypothetical protein
MVILSTLALAATVRTLGQIAEVPSTPSVLQPHLLTPMYRVQEGTVEQEAASAARLVSDLAERLRRLASAYGEWQEFEVEPYFDLYGEQAALLVRVSERVSTVHVTFYTDALLPSFQAAVDYLALQLGPARNQSGAYDAAQETMSLYWQRLVAVIGQTRGEIAHDAGFLAANSAGEERSRWRFAWQTAAPPGLLAVLAPALAETPTLTLSVEFPLPANRQPGRLQRLRRARQRQLRGALQTRHSLANRH